MFPLTDDRDKPQRLKPLRVHSIGELQGKPVPDRDWLVPSALVRRSITLFGGDGGVGKSLMMMQLQVAAALGTDWLGLRVTKPMTSYGFYCEDDADELHRRFANICQYYGCQFSDIADRVRYSSRVGEEDNELVTFRGKQEWAKAQRTATLDQIEEEVRNHNTEIIILDTVSDIFAGNENIRYQVKSFVTILRKLAMINNGGVILNAHPSKTAMVDGSGFSGSTAWNGSVRNRLYLSTPKREEGDDGPTDERILRVMKSNYAPFGEKIECHYENGVFVPNNSFKGTSMLDKLDDKRRLYDACVYLVSRGARLAANPQAKNSLIASARALPNLHDISYTRALAAQEALLADEKLVMVELGPPSKRTQFLRPTHLKYPGEDTV